MRRVTPGTAMSRSRSAFSTASTEPKASIRSRAMPDTSIRGTA